MIPSEKMVSNKDKNSTNYFGLGSDEAFYGVESDSKISLQIKSAENNLEGVIIAVDVQRFPGNSVHELLVSTVSDDNMQQVGSAVIADEIAKDVVSTERVLSVADAENSENTIPYIHIVSPAVVQLAEDMVSPENVESFKNIAPSEQIVLHENAETILPCTDIAIVTECILSDEDVTSAKNTVAAENMMGHFWKSMQIEESTEFSIFESNDDDSFVSDGVIGEDQKVLTKERLEYIAYINHMAKKDLCISESVKDEDSQFELNHEELEGIVICANMDREAFDQSEMPKVVQTKSITLAEHTANEKLNEILPVVKLEHISYVSKITRHKFPLFDYCKDTSDSQKASLLTSLNDKLELTAEELEHIAIPCLAEKSFSEFQDLKLQALQRQSISKNQNEVRFDCNVETGKERYEFFLNGGQSVMNSAVLDAVEVYETGHEQLKDDKSSMLLHGDLTVPLDEMSNIDESHKKKNLIQIQKNAQVDQVSVDSRHSIGNPDIRFCGPVIQRLYPETEIAYTKFQRFHPSHSDTYINSPPRGLSAEETVILKSVKVSRKPRNVEDEYIELANQESDSEDFEHSDRTGRNLNLFSFKPCPTVSSITGVPSEVASGVVLTDESVVCDQLALSGTLIEESLTHYNIPQVIRIGSIAGTDYFEEKQHEENGIGHINMLAKEGSQNEQIGLDDGILKSGSGQFSSESLSHWRKEFAFEGPRERCTKQKEQQRIQSIIDKSMIESWVDESRIRIRRNEEFDDDTNNFSKISCKCNEIIGGERGTMLIKGKSYPRIQPNGKVEFSLEHSNHCLIDGFHVTSTVTYTDRLYKKMARNLRFSQKIPHYGRGNFWKTFNDEKEYSAKRDIEGMKPPFTRASSVFVVYTDQNLLTSQSTLLGKEGKKHSAEKTVIRRDNSEVSRSNTTSKVENTTDIGINSIERVDSTFDIISISPVSQGGWERSRKTCSFSGSLLSHSMFTKVENGEGKESLKRSPTWLLKNEKPRGTHQMTVFERCERESIAGDGSLLHHADCLMRLNFFAERITEQIAELAAVELGNRFRAELNPRASHRQGNALSQKSSPDGRNEFMDLLRRTSGASSNGLDMSTKLPDSALAGLSSEERDHIEKVLSAANRRSRSSQSTPTASRQSIYKLPDMNDFELCERIHIKGVIEKAGKGAFPFVIKITKADSVKESSMDAVDEEKSDNTVNQMTSNTNELEESVDGNKSRVLLETSIESISLSERLAKQQNEQIVGKITPETNTVKLGQELTSDAKVHFQKNRRNEEISCGISDAEMKHIQKVTEAAVMMEDDIQWMNWPRSDHQIVENLQNNTAINSLTESKTAEKVNMSVGSNMEWESEPSKKDVLTRVSATGRIEPGKIMETKVIYEIHHEKVGDSGTNAASSMGDTNSLQVLPCLKSTVIKMATSEEDFNRAKSGNIGMQTIKNLQNYERLEKKLTEEKITHIKELKEQINHPGKLENPILKEVMETKIAGLNDEEFAQIRLVNERAKQLEKLDEFNTREIQDICSTEKELEQTRAAGERAKKLQPVDRSFPGEFKTDKRKQGKEDKLLQIKALEKRAKEMESFATLRTEKTTIVDDLKENKGIIPSRKKTLVCTVEGEAKHLQNGILEKKEAGTLQGQSKENYILTEEELMQIRAVEQRAKQMEGFYIFEKQSTGILEKRKDSDLKTNGLLTEEMYQDHLTKEELEQIKEEERNAILQLEMTVLERFRAEDEMTGKTKKTEPQQKDVALSETAFNKFANMLNPVKNSVITMLPFKRSADETKFFQNTASIDNLSKANGQNMEKSMQAYPENQKFETKIPTANKTNRTYSSEVLITTKNLASEQTANRYDENQDSEYISSSESSNFGPGTSDEDEEIDKNSVKSFDLFPETSPRFTNDNDLPKVKEPSAKYNIIKSTDLSLEVIPSSTHMKLLPHSKTKVFSHRIQYSVINEENADRFAGLTNEEIEHIKMVDLQFKLGNVENVSKVSIHNDDDLEVEHDVNSANELIVNAEVNKPQSKESIIDERRPKALHIVNVDDKVKSDIHASTESVESKKDILHSATEIDKLVEQSVKRDFTANEQSESWQSAHAKRDIKVKSLEELGREANIGKWYEERLSLLRKLCAEETAEIPGFDLKLHNLTIITTKEAFFRTLKRNQ
ncbi:unnamed protein product [Onchocerca flexuosa]|uniref:BRCA-2_OB1 domain-containing protein n=1 Tax=Onchocerca flexuosa TaxID=387005 RepID=A0A183I2E9_9BILA|nr:unnamed protein product [Onchocerca flexuosa]